MRHTPPQSFYFGSRDSARSPMRRDCGVISFKSKTRRSNSALVSIKPTTISYSGNVSVLRDLFMRVKGSSKYHVRSQDLKPSSRSQRNFALFQAIFKLRRAAFSTF
ncbi:hypothetical protein EVAR_54458_1 [Eumeta japonica]|uniref:Uncharacterized protein n=1 Tax=Eumeta variegata TaxID=151549 RepID=A0A4C1XJM4_EUMVA|nr:hypothetical protein EVAR_54458_1 [Eumeta japonica]